MCAFTSRFVRTCKPHYNVTKFAGGCPAASHFLLLRQKKVTKEKATQVRRPFGLPCGTRPKGPLRYSPPSGAQTVLADFSLSVSVPRRTHMGEGKSKSPSHAPSSIPSVVSLSNHERPINPFPLEGG